MRRWIGFVGFLSFIFPLFSVYGNRVTSEQIEHVCGEIIGEGSESSEFEEHPDLFGLLAEELEGQHPGAGGVIRTNALQHYPSLIGNPRPRRREMDTVNFVLGHLRRAQRSIDQSVVMGESFAEGGLPPYLQFSDTPENFYWMVQRVGLQLSPEEVMSGVDEKKVKEEYSQVVFDDEFPRYLERTIVSLLSGVVFTVGTGLLTGVVCLVHPPLAAYMLIPQVFIIPTTVIIGDRAYVREQREGRAVAVEVRKKVAQNRVFFREYSNHNIPVERDGVPAGFTQDWNRVSDHAFQLAGGARWQAPTYYTFIMESDKKRLLIVVRFPANWYEDDSPEIAYFIEEKKSLVGANGAQVD